MTHRTQSSVVRWAEAGLVVGVLDGLFAILLFSTWLKLGAPMQIFQGVAHALIGNAAYQGGAATSVLGLGMHFCVAFSWAGAYAVVLRYWSPLAQVVSTTAGALAAGVVLGAIVWLTMDLVILPFTHAVPRPPLTSFVFVSELIGHMIIVGPPITLIIRRA
jgi:uncharacterized membrane protein YagU involved in acid resistance